MLIQVELLSDQAILAELGKRLSRHRLNQNLTQEKLAGEAGVGINTVYRIEQGQPTQLSNWVRVLRALGLSSGLEALIPDTPPSPVEQAKLKKKVRQRASFPRVRKSRRSKRSAAGWKWRNGSSS